jgi:light-regulated signal transduction histidine kinase (bacteriophytochrome)
MLRRNGVGRPLRTLPAGSVGPVPFGIFAIFQTLASREEVESSGIGLAIVKKKVPGHDREIRDESAPRTRGTTFIFTWREAAA